MLNPLNTVNINNTINKMGKANTFIKIISKIKNNDINPSIIAKTLYTKGVFFL